MNTPTNQKQSHRHREQTCGCQEGRVGGGKDWESGTSGCKLLHTEWINKKVLYSTGNYSRCSVINHTGGEYKKECLHN